MNTDNYVELLVHPIKKKLAVRPTSKDSRFALQWAKGDTKHKVSKGIACRAYIDTLFELFGWNPDYRVKMYGCIYHDGKDSACIFSEPNSSILIRKEEFLSKFGIDVTGQLLGSIGKCVRAVAGDFAQNFGQDYYLEKTQRELSELTKEQWQTRIEGQLCAASNKLNVTSYEELRSFIQQELGDLFEEVHTS